MFKSDLFDNVAERAKLSRFELCLMSDKFEMRTVWLGTVRNVIKNRLQVLSLVDDDFPFAS